MSVSDSTDPKTHRSDPCYERLKNKVHPGTPTYESKNDVPENEKGYSVIAREVTDNADPYGLLINESSQSVAAQCGNPDNLATRNCLGKVRVAPGSGD